MFSKVPSKRPSGGYNLAVKWPILRQIGTRRIERAASTCFWRGSSAQKLPQVRAQGKKRGQTTCFRFAKLAKKMPPWRARARHADTLAAEPITLFLPFLPRSSHSLRSSPLARGCSSAYNICTCWTHAHKTNKRPTGKRHPGKEGRLGSPKGFQIKTLNPNRA